MRVLDDWLLTPERAALHVPTATAVIADLHLGYAQARQQCGDAVPTADLDQQLAPLRALFLREEVRGLAIAGDLWENGRVQTALTAELARWLRDCRVELAGIVPGNHDRGSLEGLGPIKLDGIMLGCWRVIHGDGLLHRREQLVHGHFHPCLRSGGLAAPCFLVAARRLVLPAFSTDAAGVNVLGDSRWKNYRCCAVAGDRVLDFGKVGALSFSRNAKRSAGRKRSSSRRG